MQFLVQSRIMKAWKLLQCVITSRCNSPSVLDPPPEPEASTSSSSSSGGPNPLPDPSKVPSLSRAPVSGVEASCDWTIYIFERKQSVKNSVTRPEFLRWGVGEKTDQIFRNSRLWENWIAPGFTSRLESKLHLGFS